jgi:hypothetical protein
VPSPVRHTRTVASQPPLMMTGVPSGSVPVATALTVGLPSASGSPSGVPWPAQCTATTARFARSASSHARVRLAGHWRHDRSRGGDSWPSAGFGRVQGVHGGGRGKVVAEQPGLGLVALVAGVAGCGLRAAVGAKQVVHAVPARPRGQQQAGPVQLGEHPAGQRGRDAGQRGDRVRVQVRAWVQADESACAGRLVGQLPERPGEHRADVGAVLSGVQAVQPACLKLGHQPVQRCRRAGHGQLGGDPRR